MGLNRYLQQFTKQPQITLVGPLYHGDGIFVAPVVFVDSGVAFQNKDEGFSVGDGDSSACQLDEMLPTDKDISDLGYALSQIPEGFNKVRLMGFLGGRRDHEWFNIGEVNGFLNQASAATQACFEDEIFALCRGNWSLQISGLFSLACLQTTSVVLNGDCRYQIEPDTKVAPLSSFGLSNEGSGQIFLTTDQPVFILRGDDNTCVTHITHIENTPND